MTKHCPNNECRSINLRIRVDAFDDTFQVRCVACGTTGPEGVDEEEATRLWNALERGDGGPMIEDDPEPNEQ